MRPDIYIGSTEESTQSMWVYDDDKKAIVQKQITYVLGLYKIFDEILGMPGNMIQDYMCMLFKMVSLCPKGSSFNGCNQTVLPCVCVLRKKCTSIRFVIIFTCDCCIE